MIDKKILVQGLEELSSRESQEKLWLHGTSDLMSSFDEAISYVFDDSGIKRALDSGYLKKNFSDKFCRQIHELLNLIEHISDHLPKHPYVKDVIEHPLMENIRVISTNLKETLKSELSD